MQYIIQYVYDSPYGFSPSDCFVRLCCARKANIFNYPIILQAWDYDNPDDLTKRLIPNDELCQCCETKLAILCGNNLRKWDRSGAYQDISEVAYNAATMECSTD